MSQDSTPAAGESDRGTVIVEVELSQAFLDLLRDVVGPDVDVAEWMARSAATNLQMMAYEATPSATVEVPPRAHKRAELFAEDARVRWGREVSLDDWVIDQIELRFESGEGDVPPPDGDSTASGARNHR